MPPVIAGSLTGNNRGVGRIGSRFREWRGRGVKDEVADLGEDSGSKQVTLSCYLLFLSTKEFSFPFCNEASCVPKFKHGCSIARDFSCYADVIEGGDCTINKEALLFLPEFVSVTDGVMVFICGVIHLPSL